MFLAVFERRLLLLTVHVTIVFTAASAGDVFVPKLSLIRADHWSRP